MKDQSISVLSDITVFSKYAKYDETKQRRETWDEIVDRNKAMHIKKYPQLAEEIHNVYEDFVKTSGCVIFASRSVLGWNSLFSLTLWWKGLAPEKALRG